MNLAHRDQEDIVADKLETFTKQRKEFLEVLTSCGLSASDEGFVTVDALRETLGQTRVRNFLPVYDIDIQDVDKFIKMLLRVEIGDDLKIESFVEGCLHVRGAASSLEMLAVRFQMDNLTDVVNRIATF